MSQATDAGMDANAGDESPASGCAPVGAGGSVPALLRSIERACVRVDAVLEKVRRTTWPPPPPRRVAPPARRSASPAPRLLLITADPRSRRSTVTGLLAAGLEVDWAHDVDEARLRAVCAPPDAIFVESHTAPQALAGLLAQLAAHAETAPVPVIVRGGDALPPRLRERCVAVVRGPGGGEIVTLVRALASARRARR